jgi:PAS domain S-box-containing protein
VLIVVLNRKGEIVYATEQIKAILGYECREIIGLSAFDLLPVTEQREAKLRYESIVGRENLVINAVIWIKDKTGSVIRVALTLNNLLHMEDIRGVVVLVRTQYCNPDPMYSIS